jgi:serine O-acetyltransferase
MRIQSIPRDRATPGPGRDAATRRTVPAGEYIRSDLYRYAGDTTLATLLRHLLGNKSFRYSFWLRLRNARWAPVRLLAAIIHRHLSNKYGVRIHADMRLGHGLYIGHAMGILVNHTATIGDNCNLSQFTTIGSNYEHAAQIGDNVYIGPGVCIVEAVRIGSHATIGAGAIVVRDVPENATVAGNPAKVISTKEPGRFVNNRWPAHDDSSKQKGQ